MAQNAEGTLAAPCVNADGDDTALGFDAAPGAAVRPAARIPPMAALGVQAIVIGSLFTGVPGPASLGELSGEGALLGIGVVMLAVFLNGMVLDVRGGRAILLYLPLAASILLSYAVNADQIRDAHLLGRDGPGKFVSSLMVLGLYLALFYSYFCLMAVHGVDAVLRPAARAALLAAWLLIVEMTIEVAGWFVPPVRQAWLAARHLWTDGHGASEFRLVGFAPEPSFAAITSLGLLGLLAAQCARAGWRGSRPALAAMAMLFAFQMLSDARTFMAGALGGLLAWMLLSRPARPLPAAVKSAAIMLAPLAFQGLAIWSVYHAHPDNRSVSNITRSIGMLTATDLWRQHPFVGLGLGQYGFHYRGAVPSWGLQSWEVARFFQQGRFDLLAGLPPSFSIFSRLGAELGLAGFLAWVGPPVYIMRRALVRSPGPLASVMVCALAAQIWTGLSLDSFRNPYYWLWLAALLALPGQAAWSAPFSAARSYRTFARQEQPVGAAE
jgi:hypothetical protein